MVGFVGAAIVWWWQVRRTRGWKELTASDEEGEGGKGRMGKMLIGGLICSIAIIIRGVSMFHDRKCEGKRRETDP